MFRIVMTVPNLKDIKKLEGNSPELSLEYSSKRDKYKWIVDTLNKCKYKSLRKKDKGIVLNFLCRVTKNQKDYIYQMIHKYLKYQLKSKRYSRRFVSELLLPSDYHKFIIDVTVLPL